MVRSIDEGEHFLAEIASQAVAFSIHDSPLAKGEHGPEAVDAYHRAACVREPQQKITIIFAVDTTRKIADQYGVWDHPPGKLPVMEPQSTERQ